MGTCGIRNRPYFHRESQSRNVLDYVKIGLFGVSFAAVLHKASCRTWSFWSVLKLVTASFTDSAPWKLLLVVPFILICTTPLESLWLHREIAQFISFSTAVATSIVWCICVIALPSVQICGLFSLVIPLAIGFRHAFPYQEILNVSKFVPMFLHDRLPGRGIVQARHLPFICLCMAVMAFSTIPDLVLSMTSLLTGWFYIRYLMFFPYANIRGDHSTEFSFAYLFPKFIRPTVDKFTSGIIYPIMIRLSQGKLSVYDPQASFSSIPISLYSPSDAAAASAVVASLTSSASILMDENRHSQALRFLDESIAALKPETTDATLDPDI